MITQS